MKVEIIDHMGSDLTVVNAARVSFDKQSEWEYWAEEDDGNWMEVNKGAFYFAEEAGYETGLRLPSKDVKLINYLARHNHFTPFTHCTVTFRIKAPIFVARQLFKHQVGLTVNEVSRRYVDSEPEFFEPEAWRLRAENVKQGSSDEIAGEPSLDAYDGTWCYFQIVDLCKAFYNAMLEQGICPEQARMVLPQSVYTEWYWTGSLYAFARVCKLRLDSHAQKETQVIAEGIAKVMEELFPVSWEALMRKEEREWQADPQ